MAFTERDLQRWTEEERVKIERLWEEAFKEYMGIRADRGMTMEPIQEVENGEETIPTGTGAIREEQGSTPQASVPERGITDTA
jgi:hypothetical protein